MLPDILAENLKVVFCGMAASPMSYKAGAYYAGPGNKFWRTLYAINFTPREFQPQEFQQVIKYGIGLTDLAKNVSARDAELSYEDFDTARLKQQIEIYAPQVLCFNGKTAAQIFLEKKVQYGRQAERIGDTVLFAAPSTSGAASGFWNITVWMELAKLVQDR